MAKKKSKSSSKSKKKPTDFSGKESWVWVVGALIVVIVAVSLCTQSQQAPPEQEDVAQQEPENIPELPEVPEEPVVDTSPEPVVGTPNPEIVKLTDRLSQITSYKMTPVEYNKERGETRANMEGKYQVYGTNARVELVSLLSMGGWSADYVYVDLQERTATAYCEKLSVCSNQQRSDSVNYERFAFPLPESFVDEIQYGEITGQRSFSMRTVKVVEWEKDGMYLQAYVDNYYGIPLRYVSYSDAGRSDLVSGWEFRDIAFNIVKQEDVEAPW